MESITLTYHMSYVTASIVKEYAVCLYYFLSNSKFVFILICKNPLRIKIANLGSICMNKFKTVSYQNEVYMEKYKLLIITYQLLIKKACPLLHLSVCMFGCHCAIQTNGENLVSCPSACMLCINCNIYFHFIIS